MYERVVEASNPYQQFFPFELIIYIYKDIELSWSIPSANMFDIHFESRFLLVFGFPLTYRVMSGLRWEILFSKCCGCQSLEEYHNCCFLPTLSQYFNFKYLKCSFLLLLFFFVLWWDLFHQVKHWFG